jgi:hypothetical protein
MNTSENKSSAYSIDTLNNGTLFCVVLDCGDGTHELCSSYYKTRKGAEKHLKKCQFWAGEIPAL